MLPASRGRLWPSWWLAGEGSTDPLCTCLPEKAQDASMVSAISQLLLLNHHEKQKLHQGLHFPQVRWTLTQITINKNTTLIVLGQNQKIPVLCSALEIHSQVGLKPNWGPCKPPPCRRDRQPAPGSALAWAAAWGRRCTPLTEGSARRAAAARATAANLETLPEFPFVLSHVLPCYNSCLLAFNFFKSSA